jgi:TnpA family transposase
VRRTVHAARYLSDSVYRRKISRQLDERESLHALRRDLHYARQGASVRAHLQDQARASIVPDDLDECGNHMTTE